MKELGIGVRVYVKWLPPEGNLGAQWSARMGTVVAGPFPPGRPFKCAEDGRIYTFMQPAWEVDVTGVDHSCIVEEQLLTPIDDEDDEVITEQELEGEIA